MWRSCVCLLLLSGSLESDPGLEERGLRQLQRVRDLAAQPRYGACWSRALEQTQARCQELTEETQGQIALAFTHCHLERSDRPYPRCPEGAEVRACTRTMDPVAFNAYTEFFTHAHSICHYLQGEQVAWGGCTVVCIRLTESSAGVAEQLASTQRMAEDLAEAQSATLKSQEAILQNGEELKHTLLTSTQGMRDVFAEMSHSVKEQQIAFAEIFNRVAFLQSFIMSESHTLTCALYNSLAFCAAFFLTSARRTSRARFFLFGLVALNVYLERMICRAMSRHIMHSSQPRRFSSFLVLRVVSGQERISRLVGILRKAMLLVGVLVLVFFAMRYRNVNLESLEILNQLKETHSNLQQALQKAGVSANRANSESEVILSL
uniref:Protein brambleberry-like n=1 Tax=Denticeps clupeoides TaxID=299321 RepID=A0AAY4EAV2_9TELE